MQGLVTVFGASGFVGRYAVRALARQGWRIRAAMRRPHLAPELKVMGDVGQVELVQANLRHEGSVHAALEGSESCVNLVGVLAEMGPQTFDALQARGAGLVAQAAAQAGCDSFVHVSAIGADPASASSYGRSKGEGEAAVRAAFPGAAILRPSIVFGPEDDFFNRFGGMAALANVVPLIGGGHTRFQPVYAGDVGAAIAACAGDPALGGKTYELGGPGTYSFRALMEAMSREIGRKPVLATIPFGVAELMGKVGELGAKLLPFIPPVLTGDQVEMLKTDNVAAPGAPGLAALGVTPTAIEGVLPTYLWKYRRGGQFAQPEAANAAA